MKRIALLFSVAFASAAAGAAGGAVLQHRQDAGQMMTGDQMNRLAIVGQCRIEPGDRPFANCGPQRLPGVVK